MRGMGVVDNASDENNENTRRKAKAEDIVLKNKGNQNTGTSQNHTPQGQPKK